MAKKVQVQTSQPPELPKPPFPVGDRGAFIRKAFIAINVVNVPTYECVVYSIAYGRVETMHIPVSEMGHDHNGKQTQFYVDGHHASFGPEGLAQTHLDWLRVQALKDGATPEAVRLLGAIKPFTKKEELEMAEKLKAKATGNAAALKAAAKKTPVGGEKKAPAKRGNADALAAARAAKNVNRKYKPLVKAKDLTLRDNSWTKYMVETILANKDTDSARAAHAASKDYVGKSLDFTWAEKKEYISFA